MSDTLKEKTVYILKGIIVMLLFFNSNYIKLFFATILNIKIKNISNLNYLILTILSDIVLSFIFYLIYRISNIESKRERLQKDDIVLFDEEENVKF